MTKIKKLLLVSKTNGLSPANHGTETAGLMVEEQTGFEIDMITGRHRLYTKGAVVGRKCLIESGHHPANGRAFLNQIDLVAESGEIKGRLHPGNTATDYHHGATGNSGLKIWSLGIHESFLLHG